MIELSAAVQAFASLVAAGVTFALWRVTTRYANATDKTLEAIERDRRDRLALAHAPVINALGLVDEFVDRVRAELSTPEGGISEEKLDSLWYLHHTCISLVNRFDLATSIVTWVPLRTRINELRAAMLSVMDSLPRRPPRGIPAGPQDYNLTPSIEGVPPLIERVKRVRDVVQQQLGSYLG